ncbi:ATP-binding protein [Actinoallomurus sp. NPDC052274]|uniref:sensor histidine kinase n=1 Tax=Actinoallomurus sp. NPDC052274 TaxID=3155420 RepID=UPI00344AAF6B
MRRARGWLTGRPWLTDRALGGGLTAFDAVTLSARTPTPSAAGLALRGLQTVPLFWRRCRPRLVLTAMTVAFAIFEVADPVPGKTPGPYFLIFGVFALVRRTSARASLAWVLPSLVAAVATDALSGRSGPPRLDSLEPTTATAFVAYFLVAWLLGYGARRIDLDARRLRDLGDRLRAQQEINARQAVVTERARIARDLHDIVAHHVTAALDASADALPAAIQVSVYRILQEALTNVFRHAGPVGVRVTVRVGGHRLTIEVEKGPASADHRPTVGSGRGLLGIRERVTAFDGTLHAGPCPHGGWRVHAALPLREVR